MEHDISILKEKPVTKTNGKTVSGVAEPEGGGYNTSCAFASD